MSKEFNLSEKRVSDGLRFKYYQKDIKEFIKLNTSLIEDLKKQLIIDFKTPLSEKSAKQFIEGRIEYLKQRREKLMGDKLK